MVACLSSGQHAVHHQQQPDGYRHKAIRYLRHDRGINWFNPPYRIGNPVRNARKQCVRGEAARNCQATDADSGLQLLGHRYYDSSIGRFISRDPAYAGDNWYAYCENNPLWEVDSSGLDGDELETSNDPGLVRSGGVAPPPPLRGHEPPGPGEIRSRRASGHDGDDGPTDCGKFTAEIVRDDDPHFPKTSTGKQWPYMRDHWKHHGNTQDGDPKVGDVVISMPGEIPNNSGYGHTVIVVGKEGDIWITEEAATGKVAHGPEVRRRSSKNFKRQFKHYGNPETY